MSFITFDGNSIKVSSVFFVGLLSMNKFEGDGYKAKGLCSLPYR